MNGWESILDRLPAWIEEQREHRDISVRNLELAVKHPEDATCEMNIWKAENGRIYTWLGDGLYEYFRHGESWGSEDAKRKGLGDYRPFDRIKIGPYKDRIITEEGKKPRTFVTLADGSEVELLERGGYDKDWCWHCPTTKPTRLASSLYSTRQFLQGDLERAVMSILLGEHLLAQKDEIDAWMTARAEEHGELRRNNDVKTGEWYEFLDRFAGPYRHARFGCTDTLMVGLKSEIDRRATGGWAASYAI